MITDSAGLVARLCLGMFTLLLARGSGEIMLRQPIGIFEDFARLGWGATAYDTSIRYGCLRRYLRMYYNTI
jgi:hypothetical protein